MSNNLKLGIEWQIGQIPTSSFDSLATSLGKVDHASATTSQHLGAIGDSVNQIGGPLDNMNTGLNETNTNLSTLGDSTTATAGGFDAMIESTSATSESITALGDNTTGLGDALTTLDSSVAAGTEGLTTMSGETETLSGVFAGAGTEAETLTGGLDTLGESVETTAGGLTETSTLTENLGTKMGQTGKSTTSMKTSMVNMGTAMAGLIGTGVSMFNTFDNIGDSQVAVDAAQIKVEASAKRLDSSMFALSKTIGDMNSNQDLGITGAGKFATAQDTLNGLIDRGVTSGGEWDAALAKAQEAQKGLTSTTAKGNEVIEQSGIQLQAVSINADKAGIAQAMLDNSNEALNQSYTELATQGVLLSVGAIGQFTQIAQGIPGIKGKMISAGGKLAGVMKGLGGAVVSATGTLGGLAGAGGIGGMIAILGPAALAVGAFLLAIKGIEVIKAPLFDFFSGIGERLGVMIPALKGFLTDLGDAAGATVDFLIRNTNRLLGQEQKVAENTFQLIDLRVKKSKELSNEEMKTADAIINSSRLQGESYDTAAKRILPILWKEKEGLLTTKEASILMAGQTLKTSATQETLAKTAGTVVSAQMTVDQAMKDGRISHEEMALIMNEEKLAAQELASKKALGLLPDIFDMLTPSIESTIDKTVGFNGIMDESKSTVTTQEGVVAKLGGAFVTLGNNLVDMGDGTSRVNGILVENSAIMNRTGLSTKKTGDETTKLVANWQELETITKEETGSMTALNEELNKNIDANSMDARALLEHRDAALQNEEAITANHLAYANSVDKLHDLNAVLEDNKARNEMVATAVNGTAASLKEETIQLEAGIKSAESKGQQLDRMNNAYLTGKQSILEWANEVETAQEVERGELETLAGLGDVFSDLPGVISPTVENLKEFSAATEEGGLAAIEFGEKVLDSWSRLTGEVGGKMQGLIDIIKEGGKDMDESSDKWFEDLESQIGRKLTDTEKTALEHLATIKGEGEKILGEFNLDVFTGNIDSGMADMEQSFRNAAQTSDPIFSQMFTSMANIADSGSKELIAKMITAFQTDAPAQEILTQIKKIEGQIGVVGVDAGKAGGTGIGQGLVETGQPAAKSAVITMSEEFAALGTHVNAVVSGMQLNFDKLTVTAVAQAMLHDFTSMAATALDNIAGIKDAFPVIASAAKSSASSMAQDYTSSAAKAQQNVAGIKNAFPVITKAADSAAQKVASSFSSAAKHSISMINGIQNSINKIKGKTVYIDVRQRRVGPVFAEHGFHGIVTEPTLIIAGEKRPERVDIGSTASTTHAVEADKKEMEKQILMPAKSGGAGGGGVRYVTKAVQPVIIKMKDRVIGEILNEIILDNTEAIY